MGLEELEQEYIEESKNNCTITNKKAIIESLEENGLRLARLGKHIRSDYECVVAAMKSNYLAYKYIDPKFRFLPGIIDIYYDGYIKANENKNDNSDEYADYYPIELFIEKTLEENDDEYVTTYEKGELISDILSDISEEEFTEFVTTHDNISRRFINSNLKPIEGDILDRAIISNVRRGKK